MEKWLTDRMRIKRLQMELTQKNIADELKISGSAYSMIERGNTDVKMSRFFAIAALLNCSPGELLSQGPNTSDLESSYGTTGEMTLLRQQVNLLQKEILSLKQEVNAMNKK